MDMMSADEVGEVGEVRRGTVISVLVIQAGMTHVLP